MSDNFYKYLAVLIAFIVMLLSYMFKLLTGELEISYILRDFFIFIVVYIICRFLLKYIEQIVKYYRKLF
jgi:uncharacterized membrane protein